MVRRALTPEGRWAGARAGRSKRESRVGDMIVGNPGESTNPCRRRHVMRGLHAEKTRILLASGRELLFK